MIQWSFGLVVVTLQARLLVAAAVLVVASSASQAQILVINEVQAANDSTIADDDGAFEDWFEIYNLGPDPIDLEGYFLSDDESQPLEWSFSSSVVLGGGEFLLVWASGKDRIAAGGIHTSFKLSASGETILLSEPTGELIDRWGPLPLAPDVSAGLQPDGDGTIFLFAEPTPGASNDTPGFGGALEPPAFSHPGGFYTDALSLELSHLDPSATIRFTLDNSDPTDTSQPYVSPLAIESRVGDPNVLSLIPTSFYNESTPEGEVFKATPIRARAFRDGFIPSESVTHTYWIGPDVRERYTLPVLSIVGNDDGFFGDENGIYVPGGIFGDNFDPDRFPCSHPANYTQRGRDWERPVHVEIFERDDQLVVAQNAGVRTHGTCTRITVNKSLRLYARDDYGPDRFDYPFFGTELPNDFRRLVVRRLQSLKDPIARAPAAQLGLAHQAYRPAHVFLNGEYWGLHGIRERLDEHYIESHYGVDTDDIALLSSDTVLVHGQLEDKQAYVDLVDFMVSEDLQVPANYDYVKTQIDIDEFIDYVALHASQGQTRWVPRTNNERHWRRRTPAPEPAPHGHDGRWRWMAMDLDGAFRGEVLQSRLAKWEPFAELIENDEFREKFINRSADLMNSTLSLENVLEVTDALAAEIAGEVTESDRRWMRTTMRDLEALRDDMPDLFDLYRQSYVDFFGLPGTADLEIAVDGASRGRVYVNSLELRAGGLPFTGVYFQDVPIEVTATPNIGFVFAGWEGLGNPTEPRLSVSLSEAVQLRARFEMESAGHPIEFETLRITDNDLADEASRISGTNVVWEHFDGNDTEIMLYDGNISIALTDNDYLDQRPRISGTNVVWEAEVDGQDREILLYDGSEVIQLTDNEYDDRDVRILGSNLAWEAAVNGGDLEIFLYDGVTVQQLTDNTFEDRDPRISGSSVAWEAEVDGQDLEIFLYDGVAVQQLTDNSFDDRNPRIAEFGIAWEGEVALGNREIFFYDGSPVVRLTNNLFDDRDPHVSDSLVAWEAEVDGADREVMFYDGTSVVQLTDNDYQDEQVRIAGDRLVWEASVDGEDLEVFFYDGATVHQLTDNDLDDTDPRVSDSLVAWEGDLRDGGEELFVYDGSFVTQLFTPDAANKRAVEISGLNLIWQSSDGNDEEIFFAPEPGTELLQAIGLLAMACIARSKRRRCRPSFSSRSEPRR